MPQLETEAVIDLAQLEVDPGSGESYMQETLSGKLLRRYHIVFRTASQNANQPSEMRTGLLVGLMASQIAGVNYWIHFIHASGLQVGYNVKEITFLIPLTDEPDEDEYIVARWYRQHHPAEL